MSETNPALYDLASIGGGPGGYVTALRAAAAGQRVALIEQHEPGGVCLHTGCIPTKTMAAGVGLLRRAQAARLAGLTLDPEADHLSEINQRRSQVVNGLAKGVQTLLNKSTVELINARGRLTADGIELTDAAGAVTTLPRPPAIVLATGSCPIELPSAPHDGTALLIATTSCALRIPRNISSSAAAKSVASLPASFAAW